MHPVDFNISLVNILQGQDLIVGNIGDSRAILATRDENNSLSAVQLTVDLKPNLPGIALLSHKQRTKLITVQHLVVVWCIMFFVFCLFLGH